MIVTYSWISQYKCQAKDNDGHTVQHNDYRYGNVLFFEVDRYNIKYSIFDILAMHSIR